MHSSPQCRTRESNSQASVLKTDGFASLPSLASWERGWVLPPRGKVYEALLCAGTPRNPKIGRSESNRRLAVLRTAALAPWLRPIERAVEGNRTPVSWPATRRSASELQPRGAEDGSRTHSHLGLSQAALPICLLPQSAGGESRTLKNAASETAVYAISTTPAKCGREDSNLQNRRSRRRAYAGSATPTKSTGGESRTPKSLASKTSVSANSTTPAK